MGTSINCENITLLMLKYVHRIMVNFQFWKVLHYERDKCISLRA